MNSSDQKQASVAVGSTGDSRRFFATNPSIVSDDWLEWEIVDCTTYERVCTTNTEKTAREIVAALEYFYANVPGQT